MSDLTYRKIFVGGLAWKITTDDLHKFFQQFGEIIEANVVLESYPQGRSKGYGFVTFRDAESASKALQNPNPNIDGRIANINLAYLREKNYINQYNQQGFINQAGYSHQYQNGSLNQMIPFYQYQPNFQYTYPYFPQSFGYVYYGPYTMYNMDTYHYHPTTSMKLNQTNSESIRVTTPKSSVQITEIIEDVANHNNDEETITTPKNDDDDDKENTNGEECDDEDGDDEEYHDKDQSNANSEECNVRLDDRPELAKMRT